MLTHAVPGRGVCLDPPPPQLFRRYLKNGSAVRVFGTPAYIHISFAHMLRKFQTQVSQGQVTRSRQVT